MPPLSEGYILSVCPEYLPYEYHRLGGRVWLVSRALADMYARVMGVGQGEQAFAVSTDPSFLLASFATTLGGPVGGRGRLSPGELARDGP